MYHNPIELQEEDSITIKINGYNLEIKYNNTGFSVDIYQEAPLDNVLLVEEQYWFDDLNQIFNEDATLSE